MKYTNPKKNTKEQVDEDHFESKIVGEISVDSGQICVIDPCLIKSFDDEQSDGVVVATNHGDGMYPVEEIWVNGEREGLYISLQGPYAEAFKEIRKQTPKEKTNE
tara:strand:+ start:56 stop:370 length:315 start_codon:yes stop_codon:yes gene_type:complete